MSAATLLADNTTLSQQLMPSDLHDNYLGMASSEQNMGLNTNRRLHFA
jgi:hypothetical protein